MKVDRIGFIGAGNMATAIINGLLKSGIYEADQLGASDVDEEALRAKTERFGIKRYSSNKDLVGDSSIVVLSVKPQIIQEVLEEVGPEVRDDQFLISIAAGVPLSKIGAIIGKETPLVRVMPNTPALILRGMSALAPGDRATPEHMAIAQGIFEAVGKTVIISEDMMDAVTAISGSGPGFVFRIMEGFVDAGESIGFDREKSLLLILQIFLGAAHLAVESEKSLSELRRMVTSPGGTTAAGLTVFENRQLDGIIKEVLETARDRSIELGKG